MQLEKELVITLGGYEINLTETINMILAFFTKLLNKYVPGEAEE